MGTLSNRSFDPLKGFEKSSNSRVKATVSSTKETNASKHHEENVVSGDINRARAGSGSDRLPQGKLDTPRVP